MNNTSTSTQNYRLVDSSIQYFVLHEYIYQLFMNEKSDLNLKIQQIFKMGEKIGIVIIEKVTDESLFKVQKEKPDIRLEQMKFFCKEFWQYVFGKSVLRLQTNHKGSYFITENEFYFLNKIENINYTLIAQSFFQGLFKGALKGFQMDTDVQIEIQPNKDYMITIKIKNYQEFQSDLPT